MADSEEPAPYDPEMESLLQSMLEEDEDITARGVIRRHSRLSAASSITRNPARSELLASYQTRQDEFRKWRKRLAKRSRDSSEMDMAEKDIRIQELQRKVELLTVSHVAMLRGVGELGGFAKWAKFYETFKEIRDELSAMGAMPEAKTLEVPIRPRSGRPTSRKATT
jgi:hypothetical protein